MNDEFFGHTYTLLQPAWLWLLMFLPLLWLPLFWLRHRRVLFSAALLRSLAAVLIFVALTGLSRQKREGYKILLSPLNNYLIAKGATRAIRLALVCAFRSRDSGPRRQARQKTAI
jgi:hypothetical protein